MGLIFDNEGAYLQVLPMKGYPFSAYKTLGYYDGVDYMFLLPSVRHPIAYLVQLIYDNDDYSKMTYYAAGATKETIRSLLAGNIPLYDIYKNAAKDESYQIFVDADDSVTLTIINFDDVKSNELPTPGVTLR